VSAPATAIAEKEITAAVSDKDELRWRPFLELPCQLTVELAFGRCTVRDFLALGCGSVLATRWGVTRDVPLRVNGVLIGWGELESTSNVLCVRVTELA